MSHVKTQLFSLVGRRIVLHVPYYGYTEGIIAEHIGGARFGCYLSNPAGEVYGHTTHKSKGSNRPITVDFHRGEFILPPLPRYKRDLTRLPDDSEGFAYADIPNFRTWRACFDAKAKSN
jgi:hypothetical protein